MSEDWTEAGIDHQERDGFSVFTRVQKPFGMKQQNGKLAKIGQLLVAGKSANATAHACGAVHKTVRKLRDILKQITDHDFPEFGWHGDLTGQRFGRLVVVGLVGKRGKNRLWECKCDCGAAHLAVSSNLRQGTVRSCGCLALFVRRARCAHTVDIDHERVLRARLADRMWRSKLSLEQKQRMATRMHDWQTQPHVRERRREAQRKRRAKQRELGFKRTG